MSGCDHKFIDSNRCLKCGFSVETLGAITDAHRRLSFSEDLEPKGYTDDVVAVMRDTITAQREEIERQRRTIAKLEARHVELIQLRAHVRQLASDGCKSSAPVAHFMNRAQGAEALLKEVLLRLRRLVGHNDLWLLIDNQLVKAAKEGE